jgi:glycosyltransferase involved in cell wall biosynthesis
VALSYTTRAAILRNYVVDESKVVVIPAGFDVPHQTSSESSAERRIDGPRFALMVTNSLPHKNTLIACQAFADSLAAKKNVALRVVGSLAPGASLACARAGVDLDVHAHVDDSTLMLWYKSCAFLFSPTLAEGYNLPVAEAIAAGANVLCSDIPVHREFFDEQATFFDATKLDAMVEALNHAYEREGRWHQTLNVPNPRTYRDMAADYRALFNRIAAGT